MAHTVKILYETNSSTVVGFYIDATPEEIALEIYEAQHELQKVLEAGLHLLPKDNVSCSDM